MPNFPQQKISFQQFFSGKESLKLQEKRTRRCGFCMYMYRKPKQTHSKRRRNQLSFCTTFKIHPIHVFIFSHPMVCRHSCKGRVHGQDASQTLLLFWGIQVSLKSHTLLFMQRMCFEHGWIRCEVRRRIFRWTAQGTHEYMLQLQLRCRRLS